MLPQSGPLDLSLIAEFACALIGARRGSLLLPTADGRMFNFVAARGVDVAITDADPPTRQSPIAWRVAEVGQALLVNGDRPDLPLNGGAGYQTGSFISVPVPLLDGNFGVLSVADPTRADRFDAEHLRLLTGLSDLISSSLTASAAVRQQEHHHQEITRLQRQLVEILEAERSRIARDLHDDIGQTLTTAVLRLDLVARLLSPGNEPVIAGLRQTRSALLEMASTLQGTVFRLQPRILSDLGLIPALHSLFAQMEEAAGLTIDFTIEGTPRALNPTLELAVFRLAQEGITNIVKHASTDRAWVVVSFADASLEISIRDNGAGIDSAVLSDHHRPSMGLRSMRERVETLDGTFHIETHKGRGTTIAASLPLLGENTP